eukprot:snap_masked-scaffold_13-processed-gene-10.47-mRNA-1 protein AED:1.00 eAED:1.00 QI:0/-1/0/0/-1/1/1/0/344
MSEKNSTKEESINVSVKGNDLEQGAESILEQIKQERKQEVSTDGLSIRRKYIYIKCWVSLLISACAIWTLLEAFDDSKERFEYCFHDVELVGDLDPVLERRGGLSLCNFQLFTWVISLVLTMPLLSESLLANTIFYAVILHGNLASDRQQTIYKRYQFFFEKYLPCLVNPSSDGDLNLTSRALLEHKFHQMEQMTRGQRLRNHLKNLIQVIFVIPVLFILRLAVEPIMILFELRSILFNKAYRKVWKERLFNLFAVTVIILSDPLSILLLFPLSFVVLFSSGSFSDTLVNLVAVQVFASLDSEFISQTYKPHENIRQSVSMFFPKFDLRRKTEFERLEGMQYSV